MTNRVPHGILYNFQMLFFREGYVFLYGNDLSYKIRYCYPTACRNVLCLQDWDVLVKYDMNHG